MAKIDNDAGFIWSAAALQRGDDRPSEYGKVILPLTTLCSAGAVVSEAARSGRVNPCATLSACANQALVAGVRRGARRSLTPTLAIPAVHLTLASHRRTHRCCSRVGTCTAELGHDGIDDAEATPAGRTAGGRHHEPSHRQRATDLGSQRKVNGALWTTPLRHSDSRSLPPWCSGAAG
jgi:hypothetical protein